MRTFFVGTTRWRRDARVGADGLYRSDGGREWVLAPGLPEGGVGAVLPLTDGTILAGTADGVHASRNGGDSWAPCGDGSGGHRIWSLLAMPSDPSLLFAGAGPCAILRSVDGGRSWQQAEVRRSGAIFSVADDGTPLPFAARVTSIAADPAPSGKRLYAALEVEGVLRSQDGGCSWIDCSEALLALADAPHLREKIGTMDGRKSMADGHCVGVLPDSGDLLYANRLGLFRSRDQGDSWEDVRLDRFSEMTYVRQFRCLDEQPGAIVACLSASASGTVGSIWRSDDHGDSWRRLDASLTHDSTMMALTGNGGFVAAASYSKSICWTNDAAAGWHTSRLPDSAGEAYAIAAVEMPL